MYEHIGIGNWKLRLVKVSIGEVDIGIYLSLREVLLSIIYSCINMIMALSLLKGILACLVP